MEGICVCKRGPYGAHAVVGLDSLGDRRMYRGKPETMAAINDAVDNGLFTADAMLQELMAAMDGTELTECWDYIKRMWEIEDEG